MGALPKRKTSTGRKGRRRANQAVTLPKLKPCPECGKPVLPHQACSHCHSYKGKPTIRAKKKGEDKKKT